VGSVELIWDFAECGKLSVPCVSRDMAAHPMYEMDVVRLVGGKELPSGGVGGFILASKGGSHRRYHR
jgi:hypothetical protein